MSTNDPDGFSDNGGCQFDMGVSTVTIAPGSMAQAIDFQDWNDNTFDDDAGGAQITNGAYTLNGTPYPSSTNLDAEYELEVQDSLGNVYSIQFVSANNDAYNIVGFVIQGAPPPPYGEPLTVVGRYDMHGVHSYGTSQAPLCFGAQTRIATDMGWRQAADLRVGALLRCSDGSLVELRLVLHSAWQATRRGPEWPVLVRAGALGAGCPLRDLVLSPHHRVLWPEAGGLVPAMALAVLPRIGRDKRRAFAQYVHLVTEHHVLLLAEGVVCESFWPGDQAMQALTPKLRVQVRRIMGPRPLPAAQMLPMTKARAALSHSARTNGLPCVADR